MEAFSRQVKPGHQYDQYFPEPALREVTVQRDADLSHTLKFIPGVIKKYGFQVKRIAQLLKKSTLESTLRAVFDFTYDHINYKKDDNGLEQIRTPARSWYDRKRGIDCDCYSVFIGAILSQLGIPVVLRVAKYKEKNGFQHIYVIVPNKGSYITMDPVVHHFNYEQQPILEKIDKKMDLNLLDGVDDDDQYFDMNDYDDEPIYGLGELGKGISIKKIGQGIKKVAKKISIKNVLNVVNKVNPATVLLRNGVLASMKLNLMKVAGNLRWAYLTDAQAAQKGILPDKLSKLRAVKKKLEDIFYGAGGKVDNLKKSILDGKGNKDHQVPLNGLEGYEFTDSYGMDGFDESTPLSTLLGDVYYDENEALLGQLGELGEPVSAAAIAAASGAIATLATAIKGIGSIFAKGKEPKNATGEEGNSSQRVDIDVQESSAAPAANPLTPIISKVAARVSPIKKLLDKAKAIKLPAVASATAKKIATASLIPRASATPTNASGQAFQEEDDDNPTPGMLPLTPSNSSSAIQPASTQPGANSSIVPSTADTATAPPESFWEKNKKWLKPTAIGVGVLAVLFIGSKLMKKSAAPVQKLSGVPVRRRKKKTSNSAVKRSRKPAKKSTSSKGSKRIPLVAMM